MSTDALITGEEYLEYVRKALDAMGKIVSDLRDELANRRPPLEGANSPYAILTHCLGVANYWGSLVSGREVTRDRASEFTASGPVTELVVKIPAALQCLAADVALAEPGASLRATPSAQFLGPDDENLTHGAVLLHIYEELSQHLGQMEITRDLLLTGSPG